MAKTTTTTVRYTSTDAKNVTKILEANPTIPQTTADAVRLAFKKAAEDNPDWLVYNKMLDEVPAVDNETAAKYAGQKTVNIDAQDFTHVVESFRNRCGVKNVRTAYLTRLCLLYMRKQAEASAPKTELPFADIPEEDRKQLELLIALHIIATDPDASLKSVLQKAYELGCNRGRHTSITEISKYAESLLE